MNENEMVRMIEELRQTNQKYYEDMRDATWRAWERNDHYLLMLRIQIEKAQEDMANFLEAQGQKHGEEKTVA